jgi:acyl dehydratase
MSVAFAAESLRKFFGAEVFNHTGTVNLKYLRPVKEGDTLTVGGAVNSRQTVDNGTLVTVDLYCENQNGDKTAVGQGTAIVS